MLLWRVGVPLYLVVAVFVVVIAELWGIIGGAIGAVGFIWWNLTAHQRSQVLGRRRTRSPPGEEEAHPGTGLPAVPSKLHG